MSVLTYVMTMLMLLTALTYARMESFRTNAGVEIGFINYMETQGRKPISVVADEWYGSISFAQENPGKIKDKTPREVIKANSRLSFYLLLNSVERGTNQAAYSQTRELARKLITLLYQEEDFFKQIHDQRPNFINDLLDEIERAASILPNEIKITKATRLSKLQFQDKQLQYVFYLMLHGLPKLEPKPTDPSNSGSPTEEPELDQQTDPVMIEESQEDRAAGGYVSLLDYITVRPYVKLRVYLASKELLLAIYDNEDVVEEIMGKRSGLYSEIRSGDKEKAVATLEFQTAFQTIGTAPSFGAILDFSVSNVNPQNYQ
jgi:hypothetical protein